ncbi:hypothetical protein SDRG_13790 [Saprolegnia diclina VS20]|uniref:Folate receptor-like domain-containing protein n=1 Tax=Saprolegnia diclina (strain VS20) TaxID=1156394 RepID=T0RFP2_SAPDV|nr:hypothetical protein SDRG_13790 [Saprolegnia diclina VS20]EQC28462.1 hypothetical protein SDRG_13790 [Saprolegnia diclina VS20]|eukprot:XP_008618110.1 hypothetical protein SDRG_13790 [Saprolegnia diclina VS20]
MQLLSVLLSLTAMTSVAQGRGLRQDAAAECVSRCQRAAASEREVFCTSYRNQVPRPTLFNRCVDAFGNAITVGCDLCYNPSTYLELRSNAFHYCDKWGRGHPHSYKAACEASYLHAVNSIEEYLNKNGFLSLESLQIMPTERQLDADVESAESIVERHLREARAEAREEAALQDRFDRHL